MKSTSNAPHQQQGRSEMRLSRRALLIGGTALMGSLFLGVGRGKVFASSFTPHSKFGSYQRASIGTPLLTYREHQDVVRTVAWSPDSTQIASGGGSYDATVKVWNALDGTTLYSYQRYANDAQVMTEWAGGLAWSPDGTHLVTCGGGDAAQVQTWYATDGGQETNFELPSTAGIIATQQVAWSPDGTQIAAACGSVDMSTNNSSAGTVLLWNAANAQALPFHTEQSYVNWVAWSPDSQRIALATMDGTVQVLQVSNGQPLVTYQGHSQYVNAVAWSPDGTRIASASFDNTVQVWDATNGNTLSTYRGHTDVVWTVTWSPDNQRLASGSNDWTVQVWNAADGSNTYTYNGHSDRVNQVAWSPDGTRIASASFDNTVQVWGAE